MHVRPIRESVLRQTTLIPYLTETLTEGGARGRRIFIEVLHPSMLDGGCQPVQSGLVGSALV